jgi:ribosome-interacting GTPase 1
MPIFNTVSEVLAFYGCSETAFKQWRLSPKFPASKEGPWDTDKMDIYLDARGSDYSPTGRKKLNGRTTRGLARETNANADEVTTKLQEERLRSAMLDNDLKEEKLVNHVLATRAHNECLVMIKNRLESFPEELIKVLSTVERPTVRAECAEFIRLLLHEISGWDALNIEKLRV